MRGRLIMLGVIVAALLAPASAQADVRFEAAGKWTCKTGNTSKPLAGARVEFWESVDYWFDDHFGTTYTDANGNFRVTVEAGGNFNLYVKVLLRDDKGTELENWYSPWTWEEETSGQRTHSGTVDFGTWELYKDGSGTPKCAIWQGAHNAYQDYRKVIGSNPPMGTYRIDAEFPCCGVPWTSTSISHWPEGYSVGPNESTSKHEFAHAMRHSFDGNGSHFLSDAYRFSYPQNHTPCQKTNPGFAFNEGWAEYWADSFSPAPCAGSEDDLEQEGNVAAKLKALEQCAGRPAMVRVLKAGGGSGVSGAILGGSIHSYEDFAARYDEVLGPRPCPRLPVGSLNVFEDLPLAGSPAGPTNAQIAAQAQVLASLRRKARRTRDPVEATGISAQAAQAQLVLDQLNKGLGAARNVQFDPAQQINLFKSLEDDKREFEQANQRILTTGLKKGLAEAKTLRGDRRATAIKGLKRRMSAIERAKGPGNEIPSQLESLYAPSGSPLEHARKTGG